MNTFPVAFIFSVWNAFYKMRTMKNDNNREKINKFWCEKKCLYQKRDRKQRIFQFGISGHICSAASTKCKKKCITRYWKLASTGIRWDAIVNTKPSTNTITHTHTHHSVYCHLNTFNVSNKKLISHRMFACVCVRGKKRVGSLIGLIVLHFDKEIEKKSIL